MKETREIVAEFFRLLSNWDAEGVSTLFADNIDWYVPTLAALPWTGRRTHRDEVPEYFKTMWAHFRTEESQLAMDQVLVDGLDAVAFGTFSHVAAPTGLRFTTPVAMHLRVAEGKIVKLQLYEDTFAVAKGFGIAKDDG